MNVDSVDSEDMALKEILLKVLDWLLYFKSKWILIVVACIIGGAIGFTVAFFDKTVYTAELTLALEEKGSGSSYAGLASQFGLDLEGASGGAFSGENTMELMKSRNIVEKALLTPVDIDGKRVLLINRFLDFNKWREERPDLVNIQYHENEDRSKYDVKKVGVLYSVYKTLKSKYLTVEKVDKKLSIIKVSVKSKDELFAKYFAEILVKGASDLYVQTKTTKSKRNLAILEARLDSVKRELDKNIYGVANTKDQNTNVIRAIGNVQSVKKQLNVQILTTMYGELIKNTEIAKYTLMREEPFIQVIDTPIFPLDYVKMNKTKGITIGVFAGAMVSLVFLSILKLKREVTSIFTSFMSVAVLRSKESSSS